jgi:hypothetical protein
MERPCGKGNNFVNLTNTGDENSNTIMHPCVYLSIMAFEGCVKGTIEGKPPQ